MATFTADLSSFFYPTFGKVEDLFYDVVLQCEEEAEEEDAAPIRANRLILCIFSDFFRSVFEAEESANVISIKGVPAAALRDVWHFTHRGALTLEDEGRIARFLKAVETLRISGVDVGRPAEAEKETETTTLSIEAVEEALGMRRTGGDARDDGDVSEADTEIMEKREEEKEEEVTQAPKEKEEESMTILEEGGAAADVVGADHDDDDEDDGDDKDEAASEGGDEMDVEEAGETAEEEETAAARLFKEISNTLPAVNPEDLADKKEKVPKRKVLKKVTPRKRLSKARRTLLRSDLRLARQYNAACNRRRYRLRPRVLSDADVVVGTASPRSCGLGYTREVAAISGKIWSCPRGRCRFWSYDRRGLVQHRAIHH